MQQSARFIAAARLSSAPPCSLRLQKRMPELPWHPALASSGLPLSPSALARPAAARLLAMAMAAIAKRQSSSQPPPCPSAASCLAATPPAAPFSFPTSRRATWPSVSPALFTVAAELAAPLCPLAFVLHRSPLTVAHPCTAHAAPLELLDRRHWPLLLPAVGAAAVAAAATVAAPP